MKKKVITYTHTTRWELSAPDEIEMKSLEQNLPDVIGQLGPRHYGYPDAGNGAKLVKSAVSKISET